MLRGLWNYAIKAADLEASTRFHVEHLGGELKTGGEVFGCRFNFLRMGDARLLILDKAPYEDEHGMDLPPGFLHLVYEVDDLSAHVEMLRRADVTWLMQPQEIDFALGRRRIAFFVDPNGIRTEVMQIIEDRSDAR